MLSTWLTRSQEFLEQGLEAAVAVFINRYKLEDITRVLANIAVATLVRTF